MQSSSETIVLTRDVQGLLIPFATPVTIHEGEQVMLIQALGDTFTVNFRGQLARIEAEDADALGKQPDDLQRIEDLIPQDGMASVEAIKKVLATCYDPEIPVNIVDLGLIYDVFITDNEQGTVDICIEMTLTAPGCGMGPVLASDVERKVKKFANVNEVNVKLVFDPPWNQTHMSEAAKLQLGML